tara:strand:+ start:238 stop:1161 length:924 start_codon:yes stop_codon:yes gene_type:complete
MTSRFPLGFVSAILPDSSLDDVLDTAHTLGFDCVELMCWPPGDADRRYAGVTHIDVLSRDSHHDLKQRLADSDVSVSGLGFYPNPLAADLDAAAAAVEHIRRVIAACAELEVPVMNTFIGRNPTLSVDENWGRCLETWGPLVEWAQSHDVRIGIENCPMLFTQDEWPGGHNLAMSPAIWRRLFTDLPSPHLGLNYDPSHMVWLMMDPLAPLEEFSDRLVHIHAKDVTIDRDRLDDVGILATPVEFHTPVLPGRGTIDWNAFLAALAGCGYQGPICIEVEDRDYEATAELRVEALRQSLEHLRDAAAR